MNKTLLYSITFLILCACNNKEYISIDSFKDKIQSNINKQAELNNQHIKLLLNDPVKVFKDSISFLPKTNELYKEYKSLWTDGFKPNKSAKSFLTIVSKANEYGFDSSYFNISELRSLYDTSIKSKKDINLLASLDIIFSQEAIRFFTYNKFGVTNLYKYDSASIKTTIDTLSLIDVQHIIDGISNNNISKALEKTSPKNPFYIPLQKGLAQFLAKHQLTKKRQYVSSMKKDSTEAYDEARIALLLNNYLDSSNYKDDSSFMNALKYFQHQHGLSNDGRIGRATAHMLSKTNYERYQLAAISLEKLRHKTFDSTDMFFANIPSYTLNVIENNKVIDQYRVVVGKNTTRTPTFKATMQYLILNPYWAIPYSISSKEILPNIKKNASVIEKKGYTIMDQNRKKIDHKSIDWSKVTQSNFNYRITQTRSGGTALGKVKFIFPNNYNVYFHDTPSKSLFKNDVRAYSHGCVRVHEPLKLASYILKKQDPNLTLDSVKNLTKSNNQKRFNLKKKIAVDIDYFTALPDSNNNIQFYRDIYNRNKVYKKVLFSQK